MRNKVENSKYYKNKFIEKAIKKHGLKYDYSLVEYVNSITKVKVICKEHGIFNVRPDAHITKVGCPKCNGGYRQTKEEFIEKAIKKHGLKYDYSLVEYVNSNTKVKIICEEHGEFSMLPSNHIIGQKCSSCSGVKKKNSEDFIKEARIKHGDIYDYSKSEYKNNKTKLKIICKKHGEFLQTPKDHLNGNGCVYCKSVSKGEDYLTTIFNNIGIFYERQKRFENCKGLSGRKLPFDFYLPDFNILIEYDGRQHQESISKFGGDNYLEIINKNDNIKNIWSKENNIELIRIKWNNKEEDINKMLSNIESKINNSSYYIKNIIKRNNKPMSDLFKVEIEIEKHKSTKNLENYLKRSNFNLTEILKVKEDLEMFIKKTYVDLVFKDKIIEGFNFDFYFPKINLCIKLLSNFKDCEINNSKNDNLFRSEIRGFKIIHIFSEDYFNKKEIICSRIINLLNINKTKIGARKCEVYEIENKEASIFLDMNHIQGNIGSSIKLGLKYKGELVSIMTFGKKRKNMGSVSKENEWEMLRFCNKINTSIIGSASKLFNYFLKNWMPDNIISYADKCWSNDINIYSKLGMKFIHNSKPSYFYIVGDKKIGRFAYRKDQLMLCGFKDSKNITERTICLNNHIFRIYDCGTSKYEWIKPSN